MYAVEFNTVIKNGKIEIPIEHRESFSSSVKVILLKNENNLSTASNSKSSIEAKGFGMLSHGANKELWELEEKAMERALVDNYANS